MKVLKFLKLLILRLRKLLNLLKPSKILEMSMMAASRTPIFVCYLLIIIPMLLSVLLTLLLDPLNTSTNWFTDHRPILSIIRMPLLFGSLWGLTAAITR